VAKLTPLSYFLAGLHAAENGIKGIKEYEKNIS